MTAPAAPALLRLLAPSGASPLRAALHAHGGLQPLASGEWTLNLFAASALEAGPANLCCAGIRTMAPSV